MQAVARRVMWCALVALVCAPPVLAGKVEDRLLLLELMDRYGVVHDFGTPEEYADLFSADGEIAVGKGPAIVKGREALIAQARRDHERYGAPPAADGTQSSIMRHIISNKIVTRVDRTKAEGSCYVMTMINDAKQGPLILSMSRYEDQYVKIKGEWRIARRVITLESGNQELGKKLGFVR